MAWPLLAKILADHLVQHLEESGPDLSEAQLGFRVVRSTRDALNTLRSFSLEAVASVDDLLAILLDVAHTCNSIPVETILEALKYHEVPYYLQRLWKAYLRERQMLFNLTFTFMKIIIAINFGIVGLVTARELSI
ncbi:unnamed protein product [Euphydryas editha]|uniref:Reverse transcriptase n=1 Tax=Euphydryas editha TaxID=104508 RepID=A0AAU9TZQ7_EUPED|nr:unnamed protein product [Euphydryas editha]